MFVYLGLLKLQRNDRGLPDPETTRLSALGCLDAETARTCFFERLADIQRGIQPVDLGPGQRQKLATTSACRQGELDECERPIAAARFAEFRHFIGRKRSRL